MTGSTISCWYSASRNPEERRTFVDMPGASQLLHRDRLHQVACDHSLAILLMAGLDAVIAAVELESRPSSGHVSVEHVVSALDRLRAHRRRH